jgi:hypothetical protein
VSRRGHRKNKLKTRRSCQSTSAREAERHEWRAAVLEFIRDRIESAEVYRLGETDLRFGELLPGKPGWLEQEEYEERTSVGFHLERLSKKVGEVLPRIGDCRATS